MRQVRAGSLVWVWGMAALMALPAGSAVAGPHGPSADGDPKPVAAPPAAGKIVSRPLPKDGLPPPPPSHPEQPRQTPLGVADLRLGAFVAPPRSYPFPLLGDDKAREVYVDKAGELYKSRKYSGLVPDWQSRAGRSRQGRCQVNSQQLTWVGFQNHAGSSRIFVQVEREACGYVYRPDDRHIVIDLPAVDVTNTSLLRDILTGAFPTPVDLIHVEHVAGRGARVTIALKQDRRYLSSHLGRYIFVDVAR